MADRTERTVEELDVTEVCTKLQTACKIPSFLTVYTTQLSQAVHCVTLYDTSF